MADIHVWHYVLGLFDGQLKILDIQDLRVLAHKPAAPHMILSTPLAITALLAGVREGA